MKRAITLTVGCLIAVALSQTSLPAQGLRQNNLQQRQQFFNNVYNTQLGFVRAFDNQMGARNPYYTMMNQATLMTAPFAQGGLYMGSPASQMLMNGLGAQTYGTNFNIPYNYAQVANYYTPYYNPFYGAAYNPYLYGGGGFGYGAGFANPYAPVGAGYGIGAPGYGIGAAAGYGADGMNPYGPYNPYNPYNPYMNPFNSTGESLMGAADVMRSYGKVINDQEQARITREKALQEQLNTKKQKFDLDMYIKANTPTYTQEQAVAYKNTLVRIQNNSLPGEIQNGNALNILLKDLSKYPIAKTKNLFEPVALTEVVLNHVNVTKGNYGLGLLRNDGQVVWPTALQGLMTVTQRKDIDEQLKTLVKDAYKGKLDGNVLKDVRAEISRVSDDLLKKVNEIPSTQYMAAKRFLNEFDQAATALERGEAPVQEKFQRFVAGGRSVQEVADYMIQNGLKFAPATADDEAAYRAVYSGLATLDIAMNAQFGGDAKE